jgi:hypothetical protein
MGRSPNRSFGCGWRPRYDSRGQGIAFISGDTVFTKTGKFLGKLEGNEVWNNSYVGEIIEDDRLVFKTMHPLELIGLPGLPSLPGLPGLPGVKGPILLPIGYADLELDE